MPEWILIIFTFLSFEQAFLLSLISVPLVALTLNFMGSGPVKGKELYFTIIAISACLFGNTSTVFSIIYGPRILP